MKCKAGSLSLLHTTCLSVFLLLQGNDRGEVWQEQHADAVSAQNLSICGVRIWSKEFLVCLSISVH
jgi:hypothetical protein